MKRCVLWYWVVLCVLCILDCYILVWLGFGGGYLVCYMLVDVFCLWLDCFVGLWVVWLCLFLLCLLFVWCCGLWWFVIFVLVYDCCWGLIGIVWCLFVCCLVSLVECYRSWNVVFWFYWLGFVGCFDFVVFLFVLWWLVGVGLRWVGRGIVVVWVFCIVFGWCCCFFRLVVCVCCLVGFLVRKCVVVCWWLCFRVVSWIMVKECWVIWYGYFVIIVYFVVG